MNQDTFLFVFALLLAFATGNISYLIKENQEFNIKDIQVINTINNDLQMDSPFIRLDLNSDYPTSEHLKLLKTFDNMSDQTNRRIILNSSTCFQNKLQQLSSGLTDKETLWLSYLCNQIGDLPPNFFEDPPFMHSNGKSFAYMYYTLNSSSLSRRRWYFKHANLMHIEELKRISWPIDERFQFLYNLAPAVINRIVSAEKVILSDEFYFIQTGNLKYFVSQAGKAQRSFARAGYLFSQDKSHCFIKAGNVCWKKKKQDVISYLTQTSIIMFIVTMIILVITARALFLRVRRQKKADERKKHALRVLTHELRTPVTSLLLQIDSLGHKAQNLSEEITGDISKIESEIYRLKHLAEKSKSYLQTDSDEIINATITQVCIEDLCKSVKDEYFETEIELQIKSEICVNTDLYWLRMCLTNLIENAIRYGSFPIIIKVEEVASSVHISVIDQGKIEFQSLKQIMTTRHKNSKGLGLGLEIVDKTLKALGGSLLFDRNPTTFTIVLKRGKHE